jgi:hypothetical protein
VLLGGSLHGLLGLLHLLLAGLLPALLAAALSALTSLAPLAALSAAPALLVGLLHVLGDTIGLLGDAVLPAGHLIAEVGGEPGDPVAFAFEFFEGVPHVLCGGALVLFGGASEAADEVLLGGALVADGPGEGLLAGCAALTALLPAALWLALAPALLPLSFAALVGSLRAVLSLSFGALSAGLRALLPSSLAALAGNILREPLGVLADVGLFARDPRHLTEVLASGAGGPVDDCPLPLDELAQLADLRIEVAEGLLLVGDPLALAPLRLLLGLQLADLVLPLLELLDTAAELVVLGGENLDEAEEIGHDTLLFRASAIEVALIEQVCDLAHVALNERLFRLAERGQESGRLLRLRRFEDLGEAPELRVEFAHHLAHPFLADAEGCGLDRLGRYFGFRTEHGRSSGE